MFGAAIIVRRDQIVLRLFPFKVELQHVPQTFGNPDRERVTGFSSAIQESVALDILDLELYKINKVHSPAVEHDQGIVFGMPK